MVGRDHRVGKRAGRLPVRWTRASRKYRGDDGRGAVLTRIRRTDDGTRQGRVAIHLSERESDHAMYHATTPTRPPASGRRVLDAPGEEQPHRSLLWAHRSRWSSTAARRSPWSSLPNLSNTSTAHVGHGAPGRLTTVLHAYRSLVVHSSERRVPAYESPPVQLVTRSRLLVRVPWGDIPNRRRAVRASTADHVRCSTASSSVICRPDDRRTCIRVRGRSSSTAQGTIHGCHAGCRCQRCSGGCRR